MLLEDPKIRVFSDGSIYQQKNGIWELKPQSNRLGYLRIRYKYKSLQVHRIIYAKFVGTLDPEKVINHIDGNPSNNLPSNLELVTQSENNLHRFRTLGRPPIYGARKATLEQAEEIRRLNAKGVSYRHLVEQFGLAKASISYIVNRKTYCR